MQTLGEVLPYQQARKYSCGSAALKAVLQHWGTHLPEAILFDLVGVDPTSGSSVDQVAGAARRLGYSAHAIGFDSIDELASYTNRDQPVIVAIRSFTTPSQGHFVVATKVDANNVYMMDPNVKGNRRTISRGEMTSRWKFRGNTGVVVTPKKAGLGAAGTSNTPWLAFVVGGLVLAAGATAAVVYFKRR